MRCVAPILLLLLLPLSACGDSGAAKSTSDLTAIVVKATERALAAAADANLVGTVRMTLTNDEARRFKESGGAPDGDGRFGKYAGGLLKSPPDWGKFLGIGVDEGGGAPVLTLEVELNGSKAVTLLVDYAIGVGFDRAVLEVRAKNEPVGLGGRIASELLPAEEHFGL